MLQDRAPDPWQPNRRTLIWVYRDLCSAPQVLASFWVSVGEQFGAVWKQFGAALVSVGPQKLPRNRDFHVLGVTKAAVDRNYNPTALGQDPNAPGSGPGPLAAQSEDSGLGLPRPL